MDRARFDAIVRRPDEESAREGFPSGFPEPKNYNPEGYLKKIPVDPWGQPLVYINTGGKFELYSLGADAQEGGEGVNADVAYDKL